MSEVNEALIGEAARIFHVLSNPGRIRLLYALEQTACDVSTLVATLHLDQPVVSHQLALLFDYQLVARRKVGLHVYYTLSDPHIIEIMDAMLGHVEHEITGAPHPASPQKTHD
ncbi:ArsR/SmtB family transcription factor [Lacticaseibacillus mingshuiensis]|uniref:ArsR/SmtB family transcription factor n=1 Tax=Lacticaseibacillus mingshuiensis TaxID=2799574 RepID=A0ABW4CLU1_9LACO|nr:metalloregulator ArsR/SmtB family transcription factor [Lacticaseibacillus mingshuiensis]